MPRDYRPYLIALICLMFAAVLIMVLSLWQGGRVGLLPKGKHKVTLLIDGKILASRITVEHTNESGGTDRFFIESVPWDTTITAHDGDTIELSATCYGGNDPSFATVNTSVGAIFARIAVDGIVKWVSMTFDYFPRVSVKGTL